MRNELLNEFGEIPGYDFVDWHHRTTCREKLVYAPCSYFWENGFRLKKDRFEVFDLITKKYCHQLRWERSTILMGMPLEFRMDVLPGHHDE